MPKRRNNKKTMKKMKRVREKAPLQFPRSVLKAKKGKKYQNEKKRKGFEKKLLLAIPQVSFKGTERKNCQHEKKTKRVREKAPFGNSSGQF